MAANRIRQRMARLVRHWETSDEPRRVFAQRPGLTVSQFDNWKRQVRRAGARGSALDFAPVHVIDAEAVAPARACVEVVLSTGEHLVVCEGVSVDLVRTSWRDYVRADDLAGGPHLTPDAREAHRQQQSVPLLAQIDAERTRLATIVLPKSPVGDGLRYLTNQWAA